MSRFYFDVRDQQDFPDRTGQLLPDLAAAKLEAVRLTGEILTEMPERLYACERWTMTVRDFLGRAQFTLAVEARDAYR